MASALPPFPRAVFTVIEPISLVAGFVAAVLDPTSFVNEQVPGVDSPVKLTEGSVAVALQLGNIYLLMAFIGLSVFLSTSEVKVVRSYLVALWLGDIGHVAISCYCLGWDRLLRPFEWNALAWGNIAFTVFLCSTRSLYLAGFFGPDLTASAKLKRK